MNGWEKRERGEKGRAFRMILRPWSTTWCARIWNFLLSLNALFRSNASIPSTLLQWTMQYFLALDLSENSSSSSNRPGWIKPIENHPSMLYQRRMTCDMNRVPPSLTLSPSIHANAHSIRHPSNGIHIIPKQTHIKHGLPEQIPISSSTPNELLLRLQDNSFRCNCRHCAASVQN